MSGDYDSGHFRMRTPCKAGSLYVVACDMVVGHQSTVGRKLLCRNHARDRAVDEWPHTV